MNSNKKLFSESFSSKTNASGQFYTVDEVLFSKRSAYQKIEFFRNADAGVVLALDGYLQMTERDEFFYHEMLVHPGLNSHPKPERVLIIGGGDCGTLNQVVKHSVVKEITMVEIDQMVVEGAKKLLPMLAQSLEDPRVDLHIEDGFSFLSSKAKVFDVVIVDSTDPDTIAKKLFTGNFYETVHNTLSKNGVFVSQSEIPFHPDFKEVQKNIYRNLKKHFSSVRFCLFPMPCFSSGMFSCVIATNGNDPKLIPQNQIESRIADFKFKYYTPQIHSSSMELPAQLIDSILE